MSFWIEVGAGSCLILAALVAIVRGIRESRARLKALRHDESLSEKMSDNGDDKVA